MNINDFIKEINTIYPDIDKNEVASDDLINEKEKSLGYKLPNSFKTFLKKFSNGIMLLDSEPIGGVGKDDDSPCGAIFLASSRIEKNIIKIIPTKETITPDKLIAFSLYEAMDIANHFWAFICDKQYSDNEYRVGLISQYTENIVVVLDSFEEWLTVFWEANKNTDDVVSVFHSMYKTWEEREELLRMDWYEADEFRSNGKNLTDSSKSQETYLFESKYHDVIYGDAWERKYEIEIQNLKTKEITRTVIPATNGGRLNKEDFEKNMPEGCKLVRFVEIINEKNISD